MMKPAQCRAARVLLNWSQQELADASKDWQRDHPQLRVRPVRAAAGDPRRIAKTCERAGVVFIDANGGGAGVRLKTNP
ncbi:transcriptional regulator [Mesorhizobium sp. ORM16]|uniref:transcriptional regulator n=1 Tax=Mesorhizobium sp. ORM16 TaxID=3376989 RepID=UPI0038572579